MRKFILLTICLLVSISIVNSQEFRREFGIVSEEELKLSVYEKDKDAEALVLFDIGKSVFFESIKGFEIRYTRSRRVKIFNEAGVDHAEVSIPYYVHSNGTAEKVVSINAVTYNLEDGRIMRNGLDNSTVYDIKRSERIREKKFTFPNVRPGSVIEYEYVLESPFHFNLPDWYFQDLIPTLYSEVSVSMIPFYEYIYIAQNISRFHHSNSVKSEARRSFRGTVFHDLVHTFVMRDIPAFRNEAYITAVKDYIMKIDFQLAKISPTNGAIQDIITTWPKLIDDLLRDDRFGKFTRKARKQAKVILNSMPDLDNMTDHQKSIEIINYVKSNFSWNGMYDKVASRKPRELYSQKSGNSADINLLLHTILKEAGIKSQPVIISTRNHGKIAMDYPFWHFFNYVILLVETNEGRYFTDGTEHMLAYNRIPPRCINDKGLIVEKGNVNWVNMNSEMVSILKYELNSTIDPVELSSSTLFTVQATEFEAYNLKTTLRNDTVLIQKYFEDRGIKNAEKIKTLNYASSTTPYMINMKAGFSPERLDEKLIISPFINLPPAENKLNQPSRNFPVDFIYAGRKEFISRITIPEGYTVLHLPEKIKLDNDLVELFLESKEENGVVEVSAFYTIKKSVYNPGEYARLKHFKDTIVKKLNEEVILVTHTTDI